LFFYSFTPEKIGLNSFFLGFISFFSPGTQVLYGGSYRFFVESFPILFFKKFTFFYVCDF